MISALRAPETPDEVEIRKISFLIHPVCWDLGLTKEGKPRSSYLSSVAESHQKPVHQVEQEFMELLQ